MFQLNSQFQWTSFKQKKRRCLYYRGVQRYKEWEIEIGGRLFTEVCCDIAMNERFNRNQQTKKLFLSVVVVVVWLKIIYFSIGTCFSTGVASITAEFGKSTYFSHKQIINSHTYMQLDRINI